MLLFLNFIFSYVYSTFLLYCIFSIFWFLYFTSFQCLFSFMGLFIGLITLFLVPLFILPFFSCLFFLWVWVCEFICVFVCLILPFVSGLCLSIFVCMFVCFFHFFFFLFLSFSFFSVLCCILVLQPGVRPETSKVGDLSPGCWATRELPTPWHINQWELSQRPPSYY